MKVKDLKKFIGLTGLYRVLFQIFNRSDTNGMQHLLGGMETSLGRSISYGLTSEFLQVTRSCTSCLIYLLAINTVNPVFSSFGIPSLIGRSSFHTIGHFSSSYLRVVVTLEVLRTLISSALASCPDWGVHAITFFFVISAEFKIQLGK